MPETLSIGDSTRDGLLQIVDTSWDHNGTMRVTVRELIGQRGLFTDEPAMLRRARRLARRALSHPEETRGSRVLRTFYDGGCDYVTFAVTRLDR